MIVREGRRTPETARSVSEAVRRYFQSTWIDPTLYRHRLEEVPGQIRTTVYTPPPAPLGGCQCC